MTYETSKVADSVPNKHGAHQFVNELQWSVPSTVGIRRISYSIISNKGPFTKEKAFHAYFIPRLFRCTRSHQDCQVGNFLSSGLPTRF